MPRSRILFRADASHELGFGHVARLCALIEEAEAQGYEAIAMFGGDLPAIRAWAIDRKLSVDLREWAPTAVVNAVDHPRVRALVIDGPDLARQLVPKLPTHLHTMLLDDMGKIPLPCGAVVNQNVHAAELAASYPNAQRRLLGRRYMMLRKDIRRHTRGACRPMRSARLRLVITFGGSDPVNATARALRLLPADRPLDVVVVAGPGYRGDDELRASVGIAVDQGHLVDVQRAPDDPGGLFVSADAAICSAGGTLGELAFLGCPALAYAIVRDQIAPARHQAHDGLIAAGRSWAETDDATLREDIHGFVVDDAGRAAIRTLALATADADGARRIIEEGLAA